MRLPVGGLLLLLALPPLLRAQDSVIVIDPDLAPGDSIVVHAGPSPDIESIVVYRSIEIAAPSTGAVDDAVAIIHSPRAGRRLAELIEDRSSIAIAAISSAAAEAAGTGWETVEAAEDPTDDALLALAERLCNKRPRT